MAYNDKELSVDEGSPFFLYEFNTQDQVYRYTGHSEEINWNSQTWSPSAIQHSEIKQSSAISKNSTKVTIPLTLGLASLFKGWSPDRVVTVNIRRGHFGEPDVLIYWKGRVSSSKVNNKTLDLSVESIFTSLRNSGVRARFQRNCRHALYSNGCKVNKADFLVKGSVSALSGLTLTIPEAATQTDGWFDSGILELGDGSFRMILQHVGDQITLARESRYLTEEFPVSGYGQSYGEFYGGMSVNLYPGCNRTVETCKNKFNNLDNQGGFKWIPSKNPMSGSSIV